MTSFAGRLLVASPLLKDANFGRSVVYMIEHNDRGAMGVIVNRPLEVALGEIWVDCPEALTELRCCAEGGPVGRDMALLLHDDADLDGAVALSGDLAIGGDRDALVTAGQDPARKLRARLFLGHAGWSAGQLEGELQQGGWLLRRPHHHWVLDTCDPEELWQDLIDCGNPLPEGSQN